MGSTTSTVQTEVIPKPAGIGGGALCKSMGHIEDLLLPSKTTFPGAALGGTVCTGALGSEGLAGNGNGMGGGKQKSTIFPHNWKDIVPACTSITASAVARNGLPKMTGD